MLLIPSSIPSVHSASPVLAGLTTLSNTLAVNVLGAYLAAPIASSAAPATLPAIGATFLVSPANGFNTEPNCITSNTRLA